MSTQMTALAKTTRPAARGAMPRPRLFRELDRGRRRAQATWVSSPAGAGKTTLLASYVSVRKLRSLWYHVDPGDEDLASFFYHLREAAPGHGQDLPLLGPEYQLGLTVYAQHFFRRLFARLRAPSALVLDNYQTVSTEAGLHDMIRVAVENVPAGSHVFVLSREAPPAPFARLVVNHAIGVLDYDAVRLKDREARALVAQLCGRVPRAMVERVVRMADGWAAGLVLLTARESRDELVVRRGRTIARPAGAMVDGYFERQVLAGLDAEAQAVVMETSFLPRTTATMAVALTGVPRSAMILDDLVTRNCFTSVRADVEPVYQFHDLFRAFLQARARATLAPAALVQVQTRAAGLLAAAGQLEAAAALLQDAGSWDGLARLIESRTPELLGHGQYQTVQDWLAALPEEHVARAPWLLYWRGTCRMPAAPGLARADFERALSLFRACGDAVGAFSAWAAAAGSYQHELGDMRTLDRWIAVLAELLRDFPRLPAAAVEEQVVASMFAALSWRQPDHPEMAEWTRRAFDVLHTSRAIGVRVQAGLFLVVHYYWLGHLATARQALDVVEAATAGREVPPLLALAAKTAAAGYYVVAGDARACQEMVAAALRQAESTGVHVWTRHVLAHGASGALSSGDLDTAARLMAQMRGRLDGASRFDVVYYQYLVAWRALIEGDLATARTTQQEALVGAIGLGIPVIESFFRILLAEILHAQGRLDEALGEVRRGLELCRAVGSPLIEWAGGLVEALDQGHEALGLEGLAHALALGREYRLINVWTWHPAAIARVCATALAHGIEVEYVRWLIRSRDLRLDPPPRDLEAWPWPVKIYTLGRAQVLRDDQAVSFAGKVQKRPLALLQSIIASGGHDVPEATLAEALWPEAEGDAAAQALSITLHRLRRLLGHDDAIRRQGGRLTLDPRVCWVDLWAFEHCLARAADTTLSVALDWTDRAARLYQGAFLDGDAAVPGAAPLAERLRSRWRRHLSRLASQLTAIGRDQEALRWYEAALEVDDVAEDCYRGLIGAYRRLGARTEALFVYRRCRAALARLDLAPAPETEALHRAVLGR